MNRPERYPQIGLESYNNPIPSSTPYDASLGSTAPPLPPCPIGTPPMHQGVYPSFSSPSYTSTSPPYTSSFPYTFGNEAGPVYSMYSSVTVMGNQPLHHQHSYLTNASSSATTLCDSEASNSVPFTAAPSAPLATPSTPPTLSNLTYKSSEPNGAAYPTGDETIGFSINYVDQKAETRLGFTDPASDGYPTLPSDNTKNANNMTPLLPQLLLLWESSKPGKIYFVQQEGHIVSPGEYLKLRAYKCPAMSETVTVSRGSLSGHASGAAVIMTMENAWRLGLNKQRSYVLRGVQGEIAIYDDSTNPARYVIIILQRDLSKEERQRLFVLLKSVAEMADEPSTVVDAVETEVESVFDTITRSIDSVVKKEAPSLHKSTKWLRKGTGSVVRFGGSVISKGVHLVSDNILDKNPQKDTCQQHRDLLDALMKTRSAIDNKTVTTIMPHHF